MWTAKPPFFEGEDEEALTAEFVRLSAVYSQQDPYEIAFYVFERGGCIDPYSRSQQMALYWIRDVDIQERIAKQKLTGGINAEVLTTEQQLLELQQMASNPRIDAKERLAAHRLIAEIQGRIVKAVDKTINKGTRQPPKYIIKPYSDAAA